MSQALKIVAVSGGLQRPSKTFALIDAVLAEVQAKIQLPVSVEVVHLRDIAQSLGVATSRATLKGAALAAVEAIESADVLVVGTPVYRAAYTGLFKHLFDLVEQFALDGVPVLLTATGGSDRHALVIDHELRPLFSFFQAATLPLGIYGTDKDFSQYRVSDPALKERIALAVNRALPWIRHHRAATISAPEGHAVAA